MSNRHEPSTTAVTQAEIVEHTYQAHFRRLIGARGGSLTTLRSCSTDFHFSRNYNTCTSARVIWCHTQPPCTHTTGHLYVYFFQRFQTNSILICAHNRNIWCKTSIWTCIAERFCGCSNTKPSDASESFSEIIIWAIFELFSYRGKNPSQCPSNIHFDS